MQYVSVIFSAYSTIFKSIGQVLPLVLHLQLLGKYFSSTSTSSFKVNVIIIFIVNNNENRFYDKILVFPAFTPR